MLTSKDDEALATEERKKQIAAAVNVYRERQKVTGRKQVPLMLTDEDREHMKTIKAKVKGIKNQGEAVSLALSEFVKTLD